MDKTLMSLSPRNIVLALAALLAAVSAAPAQQPNLRIGYVYPAGGKQGAAFEAVIGGQFLTGVSNVVVSGGGVQATIVELIKPISGGELNKLRIQIDELLARKAVVQKDFRALEKFRSFKNAKTAKTDDAAHDKELEDLKKKYANATWTAEDDKLFREVRMKMASAVRRPANPAISELAVVQFTVAADAEPGQRELRIGTPLALSNPLAFCVGQLPEFSEKASKAITQQKSAIAKTAFAPKRRKAEADPEITLPAVVNGQILPGEVDRYRFTASKGQRLVIAASARQLIPYLPDAVPGWFQATLALYDAGGRELAYDDDFRFDPDPVLSYKIPADGQYAIEIKDSIYRGREDFVYRITVGELPFVTGIFPLGGRAGERTAVELTGWNLPTTGLTVDKGQSPGIHLLSVRKGEQASNLVPFAVDTLPECLEKEPNDQQADAQPVTLPAIVNGRVGRPGDSDVFRFEGRAGSQIVAEVHARRLNSPLDSVLKLIDAAGKQLAFNDDHEDKGAGLTTHHADSWLSTTLPADGTYYLHLGDAQRKGGPEYAYRLRISPPQLDFALRVVPATVNARVGGTLPITVYALRRDGFSGEIALALKGMPQGFTLGGGRVPAGQDKVRVTLTAPSTPQEKPVSLEGRATIEGREVSHPAVPAEDMMQAFEYRHLVPAQELKVAAAGRAIGRGTVKILGPTPVKIPAGGTARVQIDAPARILTERIHLAVSDPPEGITIKTVSPSPEGTEIVFESDAAKVTPGQKGNLIVTASAKGSGAPGKGKAKAAQRGAPLATLPAIPFEIVSP
jgi:hypothetical protein